MIYKVLLLYLLHSTVVTGNDYDDVSEVLCLAVCYSENRKCDIQTKSCGVCLDDFVEENNQCHREVDDTNTETDETNTLIDDEEIDHIIDASRAQTSTRQETDLVNAATKPTTNKVVNEKRGYLESDNQNGQVNKAASGIVQTEAKVNKQAAGSLPASALLQTIRPVVRPKHEFPENRGVAFLTLGILSMCLLVAVIGVVVVGLCWYSLQKNVYAANEVEYPAYSAQGQHQEKVYSPADRKLAHSAQMYHYQHQKQQMIALEKANGTHKEEDSGKDSEDENENGDYTVYECPGLALTGEMEVNNPLFDDDTTPLTADASAGKRTNKR